MLKLCSINQPLCSNLTFSFSLTYKILIFINVTILSSSSMVYNLQYTRTIYIVVDLSSENKGNFPKSCIYKHDCVTLENYETEVIDGNLAYYVSIMLDAFSYLFCPKLCWHFRKMWRAFEQLQMVGISVLWDRFTLYSMYGGMLLWIV